MRACPVPFGLFSSQLDPMQTSSHAVGVPESPPADLLYEEYVPLEDDPDLLSGTLPSENISQRFRHRWWIGDRRVMAGAIGAACGFGSRWYRFATCGRFSRIESLPGGAGWRVRGINCHDRFCEPCGRERSWHMQQKLLRLMGSEWCRMPTLTLEGSPESLRSCMTWLMESFSRLRRTAFWNRTVRGGAWYLETTRGQREDHWHVHAHAIVHGTWIDRMELSQEWRLASGGSYIVHVRRVDDNTAGAGYAAKYASKGITRGAVTDPEHMREAITSFKGARLMSSFGDWHGVKFEEDEPEEYRHMDRYSMKEVAVAALRGEEWAVGVCRALHAQVKVVGGVLAFTWYE